MSKVALVYCDSYEKAKVYQAVSKGVKLIGGLDKLFNQGEKVLLKPNMLAADPPEKASITHPAVFEAVARVMHEHQARLTYGDSPAYHKPITAAKKIGLHEVAEEMGIQLADFEKGKDVYFEKGLMKRKFFVANGVLEADSVVSIPKLKTHGFARMTGSVKNQFGCVPGKLKGEMHVKLPGGIEFSKMLVDLNYMVSPKLYVMDGIVAMEGNGPRSGNPKPMNVVLISTDPIALDATICRMMNLDPEFVETIKAGYEVGMGTYFEEEIDLVGEPIERFIHKDYDVDRRPIEKTKDSGLVNVVNQLFVSKPYIINSKCIKCGVCVNMCPVPEKAVNWKNGDKTQVPVYDYSQCIRCYCCQELCPQSAIEIKVPALRKVIDKIIK